MEALVDLYAEPYKPRYPVICFDESPDQLVSEVRQRLPSQAAVRHTVTAWEIRRNAEQIKVNWRLTIPKARCTLKRLYPSSSLW